MKIYRVESDYGTDNCWTVGYYSTLDKAIKKCKSIIEEMLLENALSKNEIELVVLGDYTASMVHGINCKLNGRWMFGSYVYQIIVDDNE